MLPLSPLLLFVSRMSDLTMSKFARTSLLLITIASTRFHLSYRRSEEECIAVVPDDCFFNDYFDKNYLTRRLVVVPGLGSIFCWPPIIFGRKSVQLSPPSCFSMAPSPLSLPFLTLLFLLPSLPLLTL